ncbi:DUF6351 family protein [Plantactinospora endophytica]|uniref:DUF6351 domain-containing protein n=1 Tax=Plantactinospora endophytica TaxID=673535 RepID=A0ABQ4E1Y2_9ACTN|nr:DUF6351 family protein [Plantactinospora endophytica]GIG88680.1 hypothetical protein Pen02_36160 [Plantactinospora endophytica]
MSVLSFLARRRRTADRSDHVGQRDRRTRPAARGAADSVPLAPRLRPALTGGLGIVLTVALTVGAATPAAAWTGTAAGQRLDIEILSSRPDQVSGGDALVQVTLTGRIDPRSVRVTRNGTDVTRAFQVDGRALRGVVDGLRDGANQLRASARQARTATLAVRNHPGSGPVFSGPRQYPFLCRTEQNGLGAPTVDNQDGQGMRVRGPDGTVVGWSRDCAAPTVVDRLYRAADGTYKPMPSDGTRPADLTTTRTLDGRTVDYVVRRERGTINRFVYSIAVLEANWNRRVIYRFDGGVAIGHDQGRLPGAHLYHEGLSLGYAVLFSTGTRTATHYNLVLGGETALMLKEHFVEEYGVPLYTVGVGGSGGGLQQYVYGQNYGNRVIDAAIPQYSYPDMATQTIHVGDCELLEHYMDVTDRANPKWRNWENRTWLIGMNASATVPNPYLGGAPGSTECIEGWRGLTPLALNPRWFPGDPLWAQMDPPGVERTVQWSHWGDLVNIYGTGSDGYARSTWDNVGVQYGLSALTSGRITPAEFLDLNARVGSWKPQPEMVQEGCPFTPTACADPAQFDPWSARNMRLSPDGGVTPAPRTTGDRQAIRAAYESGIVFTGDIDIPIVDWRHYLEEQLDMHNSHQSFASRQRMRDHDRNAGNQVIWFTDARPAEAFDQTPEALAVIDDWMANLRTRPWRGVQGNKPALAVDRCFRTDGTEIARGEHVWDGILDSRPDGACTREFPLYGTSRTVAGGPIEGGVYACDRQPVRSAIARGLYGEWRPTDAERRRLEKVFPTGVCDYR